MKTKRSPNEMKPEISAPASSAPAVEVEKINRISIPLTNDGQIDFERMHGKTREKVKQLMGVNDIKVSSTEVIEVFDPAWTGSIFDSIGKLESFLASKLYQIPSDIADQAFTYSEAEKAKLAEPAAKVINKYATVWMVQFKDEIALAFLFVTITAVKLQMAVTLSKMREAQQPKVSASPRPSIVPPPPPAAEVAELERMMEKDKSNEA